MKKKLIAMLLALTMVLSLAACGGGNSGGSSGGNAGGGDSSSGDGKTYKVGFILNSSINDGGWGTACYTELTAAVEANSNWEMQYTDSLSQDGYYDAMVAYCNQGFDLIYAPGNEDTPGQAANGNVTSLLPNAQQIGWIAGALAGLMSQSGTIAFIGGMELDTTLGKYNGYKEAAAYVAQQEGKTVTALDAVYANSFDDSSKGIEFANAMMEQGADVFFGDASAVDSGARQAIDEHNSGSVTVYDIAQPADFLGQNPCIIGSQVTDNSSLIGLSFKAVEDGTFGGEVLYGDLQNGVLSAGALNTDLIPEEVQAKYNDYIQQMKDGTFMQ